ncbi:Sodium- and chloride-dependent GABA transporter 1 [Kickxella alabastrina]|nr:Sodium- and chloride-dependent GABA transporter 1 [Kickxella alabastrina]
MLSISRMLPIYGADLNDMSIVGNTSASTNFGSSFSATSTASDGSAGLKIIFPESDFGSDSGHGACTNAFSGSNLIAPHTFDSASFPTLAESPPIHDTSSNTVSLLAQSSGHNRILRRHTQPSPNNQNSQQQQRTSSAVLTRVHPYTRAPNAPLSRRSNSTTALVSGHPQLQQQQQQQQQQQNNQQQQGGRLSGKTKMMVIPSINQDGSCKQCANCSTTDTPSWRRHPETQDLLCNACGLFLRLHRKPRPIALDDEGRVQVIRKNAAVRREPINLGRSSSINGNYSNDTYHNGGYPAALQYQPGQYGYSQGYLQPLPPPLRTTTSLTGLQGIGEPFTSLTLQSPLSIDDMLQFRQFESQPAILGSEIMTPATVNSNGNASPPPPLFPSGSP